ncbi:MAG: hypothetical protein M1358_13790 [Chloroflexi bacterium]|nr:hypothetical protein [Chloroflexota bacterium]
MYHVRNLLKSDRLLLLLIGCALEATYYLYFVRVFPLEPYYAEPLLDLGKIAGTSRNAGYSFLLAFTTLVILYYLAYRIARRQSGTGILIVVSFAILFNATLVPVYPIGAADVFDYISGARVLSVYHANPFVQLPADFPSDPILPYVAWKDAPAAYGPAWAWLSAAVSLVAGEGLMANLLAFKFLAIGFYLASVAVIYRILKTATPEHSLAGTLFFAWNPLLVFEVSANAHNDIAMVFFMLVALLLLQRDKRKSSIVVLALSYLLKYITVALLPLFLATMARRIPGTLSRIKFLFLCLLTSGGITALFYLPFWSGLETLSVDRRENMFTASLPTLVLTYLLPEIGDGTTQQLISRVAATTLAVFVAVQVWRSRRETSSTIRLSFEVLFFYLVFVCLWFQPWYLMWLIALAALLPSMDIAHRTVIFCYTAALTYFVFVFHWAWNAQDLDWFAIQRHAVVTIYLLPIAYTAYSLLSNRLSKRRGNPLST